MRTTRLVTHGCRCVAAAIVGGVLAAVLSSAAPNTGTERDRVAVVAVPGDTLRGRATVTDGDTIVVAGTVVRLEGIDAPETAQSCRTSDGTSWPCGREATRALADLIGSANVSCTNTGLDKYGRVLGVCDANGHELNAQIVRRGWAWAFVRYSRAYVHEEARAKSDRVGVWQGDAQPAWEYRASRAARKPGGPGERTQVVATGETCTIKGNVTANGLIYHMPSTRWYDAIRMDVIRGKRWFCSEADALAAGWRAARLN